MRRTWSLWVLLALFVALRAKSGDAHEVMVQSDVWTRPLVAAGLVASSTTREALGDGLAHYTWKVRVGTGKYDVITVHRVVREWRPWVPARSSRAVFMVHGDLWGFAPAFLTNTCVNTMPENRSLAAYLASQDVDVWGLDLRWVGVPEAETDFQYMKDWNIQSHVKDLGTGLALADVVRRLSGNGGNDRMFLMGWSRGATIGYAYLDAESQRPRALRRVDGFVPMDMAVRFGPDAAQQRQWACERYEALQAARDEGRTEGGLLGPAPGTPVRLIGQLATQAPNSPSPLAATGLTAPARPTNRKFAVIAAGQTGALLAPLQPLTPGYHLAGSVPDAAGLPDRTAFTPEPTLFDYLQLAVPYQSLNEVVETEKQLCGLDVPFDDHLQDVKVPVLYVGAAGGVGRYGEYSTRLLGSTDVTHLIVRSRLESERALDFGHADLFLARDARVRVWQPILHWVQAH
ncbi:hypothetical protein D7W79_27265 [Corallococcus exercitus]|uniref:Lipoprotein n=1 Tax=Corallococcus exercitus TaxID=2316736 RepID=A0A3A8HZB2_9BACT|nr:hypothetical protein [Corallococcus exercitus]NOK34788.1 hypothetical protein [Corallococcus exercitus]RKG72810.1 hypothetical protein D7W79_27265 [Corallococcus exercitus]